MLYQLSKSQINDITNYIFLEDKVRPSDVIFIPGCPRPEHTEEAARLYKAGYAPVIVPSGGYTKTEGGFQGVKVGAERYGTDFTCEADFLSAVLLAGGVPGEAILPEREATYTLENAEKTRILLKEHHLLDQVHTAILCCKAHHARRAYLYYNLVVPEVEILVHPVPVDGINREDWYKTKQGRELVLGELTRIGQQLLMMEGRVEYR